MKDPYPGESVQAFDSMTGDASTVAREGKHQCAPETETNFGRLF